MADSALLDYDYTLPDSPDSDRLIINVNVSANTPLDDTDQGSTAGSISQDGSYITGGYMAHSQSGTGLTTGAGVHSNTEMGLGAIAKSHSDTSDLSNNIVVIQNTDTGCYTEMNLNQAFTTHDDIRATSSTPSDFNTDAGTTQRRLWYDMPTESSRLTPPTESDTSLLASIDKHQSFLVDSIISMENDFNPRHSTPARDMHHGDNFRQNYLSPFLQQFTKESSQCQPKVARPARHADKPPYSYVAMCVMAIHIHKDEALTLLEIREQLVKMFPFFSGDYTGWKRSVANSVRSKYFQKTVFSHSNKWRIDYEQVTLEMFFRQTKGNYAIYKPYLHEQLGVPPIAIGSTGAPKSSADGLSLPPKPCYKQESALTLPYCNDVEFQGSRKDSVSTPASSVISVTSDSNDDKIDFLKAKRKRDYEPMTSVKRMVMVEPTPQVSTSATTPLPSANTLLKPKLPVSMTTNSQNYHYSGYGANSYSGSYAYQNNLYGGQRSYQPDYYRTYPSSHYNQQGALNNMASDYWTPSGTTSTSAYNYQLALKQWWMSQRLGQGSAEVHNSYWPYQQAQRSAYSGWYPAPLNLTKPESKTCDTL